MHSYYTNRLLNIEDVIIKNIKHVDTFVQKFIWELNHEGRYVIKLSYFYVLH